MFLISNFRRVLKVVCFLLGNSPASYAGELPRRKHTTFRTRRKFEIKNTSPLIWRKGQDTFDYSKNSASRNSDAGELPRRKHTTFRTRRKFEFKNTTPLMWRKLQDTFDYSKNSASRNSDAGELPRRKHTTAHMFPRHSVITNDLYTERSLHTNACLLFQSAQI